MNALHSSTHLSSFGFMISPENKINLPYNLPTVESAHEEFSYLVGYLYNTDYDL